MTIDHSHQHFTVCFCLVFIQASYSDAWAQVSVGVLSPTNLHLEPVSTVIIVEGGIVIEDTRNLPQALCLLCGLSYALLLDYPKAMKNSLNFNQRVMLGLGTEQTHTKTAKSQKSPVELEWWFDIRSHLFMTVDEVGFYYVN